MIILTKSYWSLRETIKPDRVIFVRPTGGGIPMIQDEQVDICLTPIDWERLAALEAHAASLQLVQLVKPAR